MSTRALFGLLLLLLGVGLITQLITGMPVVAVGWPLILVVFGLSNIARHPHRPWWGIFLLLLGLLLFGANLGILPLNTWPVIWAAILIALGLRLLLPQRPRHAVIIRSTQIRSSDVIDESVSFSGLQLRNGAQQFRGGTASVAFGGLEIDLREAEMSPDGAHLEISAAFGGIEIRVPESWPVSMTGSAFLGGCNNNVVHPVAPDSPPPTLHIRCQAILGGVEVRN